MKINQIIPTHLNSEG